MLFKPHILLIQWWQELNQKYPEDNISKFCEQYEQKIWSGTKECMEWELGKASKEKPAQPGTKAAVMALLTILHIRLPPKHLTCPISHTNK